MPRFRQAYRAFLVALACLGGMAAVVLLFPPLRILGENRAQALRDRVQMAWFRSFLLILGVHVERRGQWNPDAPLWVANHISWLDIVVIGAQAPLTFISKQDVAGWPVFGFLASRTGTLFLRRGDREDTQRVGERMTWLLRQRRTLLLFPEGTSSSGEGVLRFHPRLFQPAKRACVAVQPIALAYRGSAGEIVPFVGEASFLPHLLRMLMMPRTVVELSFGPAIDSEHLNRDELAHAARRTVVDCLGKTEVRRQVA
ncbi:lysophospholipid acyltransferase family protein [Methylococcus geothermalis]|uniref:1-acyl-sn-glycerol-3-phosphate acyltransferase n=1 Tax=Methylococcus geothermalis TaxID=2681310 RepID=A0A858Q550_9GAMM|nr:lysophospholipid acyltransferase family protein [Methylococcus geothermalis]QJD28970.1 1-acyl-sn-glycerol-3-phosphate acyltransferase [Methylococcus geothermalis]